MSTNYHAATIVGCRIEREKLFFTKKVRSCNCATEETKYCQECGAKWLTRVDTAHPQYDHGKGELCGLRVFDNDYSDHVFIAAAFACVDDETFAPEGICVDGILSGDFATKLINILEPLGMWKNFGIWTIMWCS